MSTSSRPGRLLRYTLSIYRNKGSDMEEAEKFARDYISKVAPLHAKNGIEMYQQVYTPIEFRTALEAMNRRDNRGFVVDDHDITVDFYFRNFAELQKVTADPEFQAAQAAEGPYVNLVHTVVSLGWVEKYVEAGQVVNLGADGKSTYPPWSELRDLSTAFASKNPEGGAKWSLDAEEKTA